MAFVIVTVFFALGIWMLWLVRRAGGGSRNEPGGGDGGLPSVWSAGADAFSSDSSAGASSSDGDSGASGGDCGGCGGGGDGGGGGD